MTRSVDDPDEGVSDAVNDCAIVSQTFDAGGAMPVSRTFHFMKVCGDTTITSDAGFTFSKKDCQGSEEENHTRQIFSNFRLMPQPRGEPSLVSNAVTSVAYLNCCNQHTMILKPVK